MFNPNDSEPTLSSSVQNSASSTETADQAYAAYKGQETVPADMMQTFHTQAQSGAYGADMQTAASLVSSGAETWDNLFSGQSTNSGLLSSHLDNMIAKHADEWKAQLSGTTPWDSDDNVDV